MASIKIQDIHFQSLITELDDNEFNSIIGGRPCQGNFWRRSGCRTGKAAKLYVAAFELGFDKLFG